MKVKKIWVGVESEKNLGGGGKPRRRTPLFPLGLISVSLLSHQMRAYNRSVAYQSDSNMRHACFLGQKTACEYHIMR